MKSSRQKAKQSIEQVYPTWESTASLRVVLDKCGYDSTQKQLGLSNLTMKVIWAHLLKLEALQQPVELD